MKRLWTAAALLALLLAGSLLNARYIQSLSAGMTEQLEQAQAQAERDNWDQAGDLTRQAFSDWQEHRFYLHAVMRHADTDQILRSFQSVLQYLDLHEMDQYAAANVDLAAQLRLLAEMELPTLENVL